VDELDFQYTIVTETTILLVSGTHLRALTTGPSTPSLTIRASVSPAPIDRLQKMRMHCMFRGVSRTVGALATCVFGVYVRVCVGVRVCEGRRALVCVFAQFSALE